MFRKIKKLYFKIYHLFKLIGIFILIFGLKESVYAEECTNLLEYNNWRLYNGNYFLVNNENTTYWFSLPKNTTYTIFFNNGELPFNQIYTNQILLMQIYYKDQTNTTRLLTQDNTNTDNKFTFTTNEYYEFQYYIRLQGSSATNNYPFNNNITYTIKMVQGENVCEEVQPIEDNVYESFLSIYIDRIRYLAEGFITNKYLLSMIGIIFGWAVLELFLKILHLRGGKVK